MKERGLLLYVCFTLLVASRERMGFKRGVTTRFTMVRREESTEYWRAYIRRRTMDILDRYYNLEESDFWVSPGGRVKMIGEKRVRAADWVYKKYGILNPRPTFTRIETEAGEIYRIDCPPEWEEDVIFAPVDFKRIRVKLKVPLHKRMARPILIGAIVALTFLFPPVALIAMGKGSGVFHFFKYEDFTEIVNAKDEGIIGDGVADETDNLEILFTNFAGRVIFFPRGAYNVDQWDARILGAYNDLIGPQILTGTTMVGEGDGTNFVALSNALYMFYVPNDDVTIKDVRFTGTGVAGGGNLSSGSIYSQNADNLHIINSVSNNMIGPGGINSRGFGLAGDQIGTILQDSRMDNNEHGMVLGAPDPPHGTRILACYSNDAVEKNYYFEGIQAGVILTACVSDGTGGGCYVYYASTSGGGNFSGNSFLSSGNGLEPYQAVAFTGYNATWSHNICQTGGSGMYPQCSMMTFVGNVCTFNTINGYYSFVRFSHNMVSGNVFSHNSDNGMYMQNDTDYNHYMHNLIIDNTNRAVYFRTGTGNHFCWNRIYSSDTGTYHTSFGLDIEGATYTFLQGNDLRNAGATVYRDLIASTIWAGGNLTIQW